MSLRIWLPMTKDLRNQGLSNVTVTNNGATFNSTGKLGGCYEFASGKRIQTTLPPTSNLNSKAISFACWINVSSWNSSYDCLMSIADGTGWQQSRATLSRNNTASTLTWNIADGSTSTRVSTTTSLSTNTWYHIACTYDGASLKIYVNGTLNNSAAATLSIGYAGTFNIGGWSGNNYPINCKMNDVRVYSHCLSPMEVKDLAKGLVLHYPLNRQGWGQENLILHTYLHESDWWTGNTSSATVSNNKVTIQAAGEFYQKYGSLPTTSIPSGTTLTLSCYFYENTISSGNRRIYYACSPSWKYVTVPANFTGLFTSTFTTTEELTKVTIDYDTRNWTSGKWVCGPCKLEYGSIATPWCPNLSDTLATTMGLNSTTEYDCSGFCNNGTRTGTFSWTSDTPKYAVSTTLGNNTTKVHIGGLSTTGFANSYSFAWWGKTSTFSNMMQWGFSDGIRLNGIYNGTLWNTGDGSNNPLYNPGTTTQVTAPTTNVWHHYVMVGDGTTCKVYKDGELWGQAKTYKAISGTSIYFNGWDSGTSYSHTAGYSMSDFRIYATALSADDVKSLYQNSAYIDSSGNVYGAVHSEV